MSGPVTIDVVAAMSLRQLSDTDMIRRFAAMCRKAGLTEPTHKKVHETARGLASYRKLGVTSDALYHEIKRQEEAKEARRRRRRERVWRDDDDDLMEKFADIRNAPDSDGRKYLIRELIDEIAERRLATKDGVYFDDAVGKLLHAECDGCDIDDRKTSHGAITLLVGIDSVTKKKSEVEYYDRHYVIHLPIGGAKPKYYWVPRRIKTLDGAARALAEKAGAEIGRCRVEPDWENGCVTVGRGKNAKRYAFKTKAGARSAA